MDNCRFENAISLMGGGIYMSPISNSNISINNSEFDNLSTYNAL